MKNECGSTNISTWQSTRSISNFRSYTTFRSSHMSKSEACNTGNLEEKVVQQETAVTMLKKISPKAYYLLAATFLVLFISGPELSRAQEASNLFHVEIDKTDGSYSILGAGSVTAVAVRILPENGSPTPSATAADCNTA